MKDKYIKGKFRVGELVRIKQSAIDDGQKMVAHIPVVEWNMNKIYVIEELGWYGPSQGPIRQFVLVAGSSQFTHPKYFEKVKCEDILLEKLKTKKHKFKSIVIDDKEYLLVPKERLV